MYDIDLLGLSGREQLYVNFHSTSSFSFSVTFIPTPYPRPPFSHNNNGHADFSSMMTQVGQLINGQFWFSRFLLLWMMERGRREVKKGGEEEEEEKTSG